MSYVALYRRYRPQDFDALIGQEHIRIALTNAIEAERIAHAYLFTGPRGTGKTSTARILAKALNCEKGPTAHPCNECENCRRATEGSSMDVMEIDAASNRGIDEIRQLREKVAFAPVNGRYKVYIIDEVHMLTTDAFNALLKTLEEPPKHVVFILATTEPHKIPATIHSRCQRFDFHRVTLEDLAKHLQVVAAASGIEAEAEALQLIAIQADGGMRDALSLLDQCAVMAKVVTVDSVRQVLGIVGREGLRELALLIGQQKLAEALTQINNLNLQGKDVRQILVELAEYLRAVLLYKTTPDYAEIYLTDTKEAINSIAQFFSVERIVAAEQRIHQALEELRWTVRGKITAELCLFDLCQIKGKTLEALLSRIEQLELQLAQGAEAVRAEAVAQTHVVSEEPAALQQSPINRSVKPAAKVSASENTEHKTSISHAATQASFSEVPVPNEITTASEASVLQDDLASDLPQGEALWTKALAQLKAKRKMALNACAMNGMVVNFNGSMLTVSYKSKTFCERMNKSDYKNLVEEILSELTGTKLGLKNIVAEAKVPAAKKQAKPEEEADLQKALEVFGGTVKKL